MLHKRNRGTMDAVAALARLLKRRAKDVGYAGTKDKRAVTTQWCTCARLSRERLAQLNRAGGPLDRMGVRVGNCAYVDGNLFLGALKGNRFTVTLRDVRRPPAHAGQHTDEILAEAGFDDDEVAALRASGAVA